MMDMSIPYELKGRRSQKARTRAALVQATRALLAEGVTPTVEQTAQRAAIARTTAYRYFPNQSRMLLAAYPELDEPSLLDADAPLDAESRLEIVTEQITQQVVEHEIELRATLRMSLDPHSARGETLPLRQGRVVVWVEDALSPLQKRMSAAEIHRLALTIRVVVGIEAFVWLTDVGRLSREEAVATMKRSAQALLRCATQESANTQ
jgi:AcrR family transcriptional regulator